MRTAYERCRDFNQQVPVGWTVRYRSCERVEWRHGIVTREAVVMAISDRLYGVVAVNGANMTIDCVDWQDSPVVGDPAFDPIYLGC